jgi:hypothetical protein
MTRNSRRAVMLTLLALLIGLPFVTGHAGAAETGLWIALLAGWFAVFVTWATGDEPGSGL